MTMIIQEPSVSAQLIEPRQKLGIDGRDEVWNGVYVVTPLANLDHQDLVANLHQILYEVVRKPGMGRVQPGANVSDREENWRANYRVPDLVVVLDDGAARDCGTHWLGGLDFLVEVISPEEQDLDDNRAFYEQFGVREFLSIHRDSRDLALYGLSENARLLLTGESTAANPAVLPSRVLSLQFQWSGSQQIPRTWVKRTGVRESFRTI